MIRPKEVTVHLDGETLNLRFDFNAAARIEELVPGSNVLEGIENPTATYLRAIVFACCAAYDDKREQEARLSLWKIGSLMHEESVPNLNDALRELMGANMPEGNELEEADEMEETDDTEGNAGPGELTAES